MRWRGEGRRRPGRLGPGAAGRASAVCFVLVLCSAAACGTGSSGASLSKSQAVIPGAPEAPDTGPGTGLHGLAPELGPKLDSGCPAVTMAEVRHLLPGAQPTTSQYVPYESHPTGQHFANDEHESCLWGDVSLARDIPQLLIVSVQRYNWLGVQGQLNTMWSKLHPQGTQDLPNSWAALKVRGAQLAVVQTDTYDIEADAAIGDVYISVIDQLAIQPVDRAASVAVLQQLVDRFLVAAGQTVPATTTTSPDAGPDAPVKDVLIGSCRLVDAGPGTSGPVEAASGIVVNHTAAEVDYRITVGIRDGGPGVIDVFVRKVAPNEQRSWNIVDIEEQSAGSHPTCSIVNVVRVPTP